MNSQTIKEQIEHSIGQIEKGIAAISTIVSDDVTALGDQGNIVQAQLQILGHRRSKSSRIARNEIANEIHRHPYAILGTVLAVGALAAALLWRNDSRH